MSRTATVLVVDDDPSIRQTMEAIVRAAGMSPLTAATGEDAILLLRKSPVDVMLLDVQLPGMSGLDVLRLIREGHPDVGVIMVSVVKEIPIAVEAIKLGALDYLTKDFSPGELSARVSKSLEQLRALEHGHRIRVVETSYRGFGVDTPEDLKRAHALLAGA